MNYTRHFECGCKVAVIGEITNAKIVYCPKHKAAEEMYEALKAVDDYLSAPYPENMKLKQIVADKLVASLNTAEGRQP